MLTCLRRRSRSLAIRRRVSAQSLLGGSTDGRSHKAVHTGQGETHQFAADFPEKYDALKRKLDMFGVGKNPLDLYKFGPNGELVGRNLYEQDIVKSREFKVKLHGTHRLNDIDIGQPTFPAAISGFILNNNDDKADRDVAIAVNGVILATTKTFMHGTQERFATLIPETALRKGANRVEAFVVRKTEENGFQLLGSGHIIPKRNEGRAKRHAS